MTSRSDRLREFLAANGPFEGSVGDLADEMPDPSASALSASVSVAIREGWLRRFPEEPGARAQWLWLSGHEQVAQTMMREAGVDVTAVPPPPEPWPTQVRPDPDKVVDVEILDPDDFAEDGQERPIGEISDVLIDSRGVAVIGRIDLPIGLPNWTLFPVMIDVGARRIEINGEHVTCDEVLALIRDLEAAVRAVAAI